ncbi:hypothetical protein Tco_1298809, partial [Tanacetum coccineum]
MWSFFHKRDYNVVADLKRRKYHLDKLASNSKYEANYVLFGFVFPLKVTPSTPVLRSSTRGSSNSKSVDTRVRTEVFHEVHVCTETVKDQQQMIVDLQRRLLLVEHVTKKLRTGPSDVDHLDKNGNQYDNVPVGGLDHQSMDGVSQCMNNCNDVSNNFPVDGLDHQSMKGVSHCTSVDHISQTMKEVDESVAIDGLIRLRSQDVDHTSKESIVVDDNDFEVKDTLQKKTMPSRKDSQQVEDVLQMGSNHSDDDDHKFSFPMGCDDWILKSFEKK